MHDDVHIHHLATFVGRCTDTKNKTDEKTKYYSLTLDSPALLKKVVWPATIVLTHCARPKRMLIS